MKALHALLIPVIAMVFLAFMAHVVLFTTNSMAITITMGWLMGIPMLASVRLLKYVSFDYSGCDKYPTPWATAGRSLYSHGKDIASIPYSYSYKTPIFPVRAITSTGMIIL